MSQMDRRRSYKSRRSLKQRATIERSPSTKKGLTSMATSPSELDLSRLLVSSDRSVVHRDDEDDDYDQYLDLEGYW